MKVLQYPHPALMTYCNPVTEFDDALRSELDAATKIMIEHKGIGIAANQLGIMKRFFVMKDHKERIWEFVNPEIIEFEESSFMPEGCLSAPGVSVQVSRSKRVTVRALDRKGEEFTVCCDGYDAITIQHELDHINGLFFLDKVNRKQRRALLKRLK